MPFSGPCDAVNTIQVLQALSLPGLCCSSAAQPVLAPLAADTPCQLQQHVRVFLNCDHLSSPHQHFPCPQVSSGAQNCSPAEIPLLFGSRGSAATLSEHRGNVCVAVNGLQLCLTWGKMSISKLYTSARDGGPYQSSPKRDRAALQCNTKKGSLL